MITANQSAAPMRVSGISRDITPVKAKLGDTVDSTKLYLRTSSDDLDSKVIVIYILADADDNAMLSGAIQLTDAHYTRTINTLFTTTATYLGVTLST